MHLPPHVAEQLGRVPKSSDGYCQYAPCQVTLKSGELLERVYLVEGVSFQRVWGDTQGTLNGKAVDFPNWPPGIGPADVVGVQPHVGHELFRDRAPAPHEGSADYAWCLYDA